MGAAFLDQIDWRRPWLSDIRQSAAPVLRAVDWLAALNAESERLGLVNHRGLPIRFVPQATLPAGTAYEAFISATGCVPTRDNLHDFFNAMVWLTYPRIKVRLNALQVAEIARLGTSRGDGRGKVRDAATIFDENAALLVVGDTALLDSLRAHDWRGVLLERRERFSQVCQVRLFGHALMEKLVQPYKAITAHAWAIVVDETYYALSEERQVDWLDSAIARQLTARMAPRDFTPLPVLGVPGWWSGQGEAFYADASVFRPERKRCQSPS